MDNDIRANEREIVEKAKQGFEVDLFAQNYRQIHSDERHLISLLNLCQFVKGKRYLDVISSWWCNLHGHCHPRLARAAFEQAKTLDFNGRESPF